MTASRARTIAQEVTSGDPAKVADALDLPGAPQPTAGSGATSSATAGTSPGADPSLVAGLAAFKKLHLREGTFRQVDNLSAIAQMVTTDQAGKQTTWTVTLILRAGLWHIALTTPEGS